MPHLNLPSYTFLTLAPLSQDDHWYVSFSNISLHFLRLYRNRIKEHIRFGSGFFHSEWLFWDSSTLLPVSTICSFLLLSSTSLHGYTIVCVSIHLLMNTCDDSKLGLLQKELLWTILYKSLYVCTYIFLQGNT